jgi:hypothetical protein
VAAPDLFEFRTRAGWLPTLRRIQDAIRAGLLAVQAADPSLAFEDDELTMAGSTPQST